MVGDHVDGKKAWKTSDVQHRSYNAAVNHGNSSWGELLKKIKSDNGRIKCSLVMKLTAEREGVFARNYWPENPCYSIQEKISRARVSVCGYSEGITYMTDRLIRLDT